LENASEDEDTEMIRLNDEGNFCWDAEDREMVHDMLASVGEELAYLNLSDAELNWRVLAEFNRMRLRQLN
jgi:AICAR transformylase/IMP cyclohydrolase PurH